ncbi:MAG: hypothetical protein ABSB67_19045 [Bryobacteraceae bacterium]|jgi:hypothetical protein
MGTYHNAWRVVRDGIVVFGSQDAVDSIDELNVALGRVELGRFVSLRQPSDLDVRIEFDNGIMVDILSTISHEDESFHIFCPGSLAVTFSVRGGWKIGPSDKPWGSSDPIPKPEA